MSNTMGRYFRLTTFGESHGAAIGAVVDGCPPGVTLNAGLLQGQLDRRRPGRSARASARGEHDVVEILSGVENGATLGTPVGLLIRNVDSRPRDYARWSNVPRPSHADLTYRLKYGVAASSGGGRASARETAARVAGGALAETLLRERHGVEIVAWVESVAERVAADLTAGGVTRADVDAHEMRCPDSCAAADMLARVDAAREAGDSVGGIIACVCRNVPPGWGEPVFGKTEAVLAAAMLSIPACKGFEIGSGFAGARQTGSQHNDLFVARDGKLRTATNRSGGVQGGITNGETVVFRAAFKPVATIAVPQATVDYGGRAVALSVSEGRHDPCVLPRAVPIVEAMAALVLADLALAAMCSNG